MGGQMVLWQEDRSNTSTRSVISLADIPPTRPDVSILVYRASFVRIY